MNKIKKICLISSSGGHFEQLKSLAYLEEEYDLIWITEKTSYDTNVDYVLPQTGLKDKFFILKMSISFFKSLYILIIENPDFIISTGAMISIPMILIGKFLRKKIIFIETFARITDGTRTGKLIYKYADLFIVQWESLKEIYPNSVYGGSIY